MDAIQKPNKVSGSGRDALLYSYTPSIQLDKVEDMYMKLQNEYRGYQAELNSMKHEVQTKVEQDKAEKDLKFKEIYEAYSLEMVKLNNQLRTIKNKKVKEIQDLKIIIPDSLKDIYEEVSKLGKK